MRTDSGRFSTAGTWPSGEVLYRDLAPRTIKDWDFGPVWLAIPSIEFTRSNEPKAKHSYLDQQFINCPVASQKLAYSSGDI